MLQLVEMMLVALVAGYVGNGLNRDSIPGGMIGSAIAGLAGAWLGTLLLGNWGPDIMGHVFLPSVLGAAGFMCILGILSKMTRNTA
jgi:uncharacterized membrane protein YeaQ/YmgE (transglycosylase-associated protein family)